MQAADRVRGVSIRPRIDAALRGRTLPVVAAIVTAVAVAWMWGGLDQPGAFHDERAYLVQARLLAEGAWTAASPPLPIFWAMPHLYVEPALFAKYPPGFAPLLVPGVLLGVPGLMPALFAGIAAALLVLLVRGLAGPVPALAAWLLWVSAPKTLDWHASYLSETATVPLYLGALLALLAYLKCERRGALIALVICVSWLGITRPVTGIALGVPIAIVILHRAWRTRRLTGWRPALLVAAGIAALVPYWSWRTLGSPLRMPYSEYSQEYFPWDMPGFVRDTTPPRRPLPPDFEALAAATGADYREHRPSRIPGYFVTRGARVLADAVGGWAWPVAFLAPLGLVLVGAGVATFAIASATALLLAYTVMPHAPPWTIYYLELFPLVAAAVAVAATRAPRRLVPWIALAGAAVLVGNLAQWPLQRHFKAVPAARQRLAQVLVRELEDPRAVVFVRRDSSLSPHFTLWDILGAPESTPTWIVRDLGPALNLELLRFADGRRPYLLDERTMTLTAWNPAAEPAGAPPAPR